MEGRSTAAGKVLDVLATFDRERQSQTLTQIAQRTGLALSTAHRVVTELAEWGALERGEDGAWHVGLRLWEVAAVCPRTQILRDVALPFMQDLYEATHENIQLAVREGTELVFVERIAGHRSVELRTMVGGRFPLSATGMGRVLLAHAPAEIQEAVLASPLDAWTPYTVTDPDVLRAQLDGIRREQVVVSDRQLSESTLAVAAPVRVGPSGPVHAALGVVVAADPGSERVRALRHGVLRSAQAVSAELGRRAGVAVVRTG
ncbi:IclR family transcriptional regulator [Phycicoccus endophyticus]|uniref:IclR family transcriptional regulator n=1 Tax=Phycicoccus endophyticus TaxID=1690220 RepID=UPI0014073954|nr:IclR family transcriptional regulator [Phycicoccus endophyticus]NHI19708.1 IclR family transcriptional regulator [Phycicoccus endophyticus]GGL33660.1 transcriptional regulator [Phycicoccus endophyticus]